MYWRKIRDTSEMNLTAPHCTANLHSIHEVVAWPDFWVLRGASATQGHTLYGLDVQANRLVWSLTGLACPEGLGWSWKAIPLLARTEDLAVVATYVGQNRERAWLLALAPRTGELVWRKPLDWQRRTSSGKGFEQAYIGIGNTGQHLLVMENRAPRGEEPYLLWLDPASGETVHACPAPAIADPAVIAGGYVYLYNGAGGQEQGLYRVPVTPGAQQVAQCFDSRVTSLRAAGEGLYGVYTEDLYDWTFARWDACTLERERTQQRHWEEGRSWPRLMAVDPAQPDHVIVHRDTLLWGLDLSSDETLWQHTFAYSTHVKQVLYSSHGAWLNAKEGLEGLDLNSGARADRGMGGVLDRAFVVGDYALTSPGFGTGCSLYVAPGTPAAAAHPVPVRGDETWTAVKLRALLPDLLTDPRDELQTAFQKAAGRGSLKTLGKAVRQVIQAGQTHHKVKAYLEALQAGKLDAGPLNFTPLAELYSGFFYYPDLFSFGPDERFFPGALIAGEWGGVEFYLMWETGKVISLHHDASFYEVASDVWGEVEGRIGAFEREFPVQGGVLDIAQLVRFQQAFADVESTSGLSDLDRRDFLTRTATALGWNLEQLRRHLDEDYLALEFLNVHEEEMNVLDGMLAAGIK